MGPDSGWTINIGAEAINSQSDLGELHFEEEWKQEILQFLRDWFSDEEKIELYSSGSTGKAKLISYRKDMMQKSALRSIRYFDLKPGQSALLCLPPKYIGGKMMILRSILAGLQLEAIKPGSDPLQKLNTSVDFVAMTPMQVQTCIEEHPKKLKMIRKLIIGGAPLSKKLSESLVKLRIEAYETYGMTETCSHVALRKLNEDRFKAMEGVQFRQISNGELVIDDEVLGIESLRTTDVVELSDSQSFRWLGRSDWVINSGGIKIHPEELEEKLNSCLNFDFFLTGIPDEKLGTALVMVYESDHEISEKDLTCIQRKLTKYQIPKRFLRIDQMIKTPNSKHDRNASLKKALIT
jgi:O-succinylbenzoic acid--CoA ligase